MSSPPEVTRGGGRRRWLSVLLRAAVAVTLLGLLALSTDLRAVADAFSRIHPGWTALTAVGTLSLLVIGAVNVWILLRALSPVPFGTFLRVYLASWAIGLLLPGQLGDASQVVLLRRHGVPASRSGAAYTLDKAVSFLFLCAVATVAAGWFVLAIPVSLLWLVPLALLGGAAVAVIGLRAWKPEDGRRRRLRDGLVRLADHVLGYRKRPGLVALNLAVTVGKWLVLGACYWAAFRAFGQALPFGLAAGLPVVSTLVGYIPISIAGLGTVEWSAVYLFESQGWPRPEVLSVYLLLRVILVAAAALTVLGSGVEGGARRDPGPA